MAEQSAYRANQGVYSTPMPEHSRLSLFTVPESGFQATYASTALIREALLMNNSVTIRNSTDSDIDAITSIYRHEVLTGLASFEIEPPDSTEVAKRRSILVHDGYPYLVAECDNQVVGYAYAGPYRARPAYQHTLENSIYVAPAFRNKRVGKTLLTGLINTCSNGPWHTVIAVIGDTENAASIALHTSVGFEIVGTLKDVGHKHGNWVNSVLMQILL